jgi:hypothetical protein
MAEMQAWVDDISVAVHHAKTAEEAVEFLKTWHDPECNEGFPHEPEPRCFAWRDLDPARARELWYRWVPGCPEWCRGFASEPYHKRHLYDAKPHTRGAFRAFEWWHGSDTARRVETVETGSRT